MKGVFGASYWRQPDPGPWPMRPFPRPSGSVFGYLLVVLMSVFYIAVIANGLRLLTGSPFFLCLIFAGVLYAMKIYFLRRQPPHELAVNSGWDKVVGYLATSIVSVILAAYGLYGLNLQASEAFTTQTIAERKMQNDIGQPANHNQLSREQMEIRIRELEEDLALLSKYQPTLARDKKIADFESELRMLRNLLEISKQDSAQPNIKPSSTWHRSGLEKSVVEVSAVMRQDWDTPTGGVRNQLSPSTRAPLSPTVTEKSSYAPSSDDDLSDFVKATLAQTTSAIGCWIASAIIEVLILILVLYNRPRYSYWD